MAQPDYNQWLNSVWGWPDDYLAGLPGIAAAANVTFGPNPPYSALDFLATYPKFSGSATPVTGTTDGATAFVYGLSGVQGTAAGQLIAGNGLKPGTVIMAVQPSTLTPTGNVTTGSAVITGVSSLAGVYKGLPIAGTGIELGVTIADFNVGAGTITMSAPATATAGSEALSIGVVTLQLSQPTNVAGTAQLSVYEAPLVPIAVINAYIYFATSSVMQSRWFETWQLGMGLFIAHYATLWLQGSEGVPNQSAARAASSGLASGIMVSKSADGLSASYQPVTGLEDWGAWNLTRYGQMFATLAKGVGAGGMLIY